MVAGTSTIYTGPPFTPKVANFNFTNGEAISAKGDEYARNANAVRIATGLASAKDGNEHADANSIAGSIAENGDEYARHANASGFTKSTSVASGEDGNEHAPRHANAVSVARRVSSKNGHEYADAVGESLC